MKGNKEREKISLRRWSQWLYVLDVELEKEAINNLLTKGVADEVWGGLDEQAG